MEHLPCGKRARMLRDDGRPFRDVDDTLWSVERRLEGMDGRGVDVHVLSTVPVMFSHWAKPEDAADLAVLLNDHMAATVAHNPRRLVGLGMLPMQSPTLAVAELKRCVGTLGLAGVQIGTHINDWPLSEAQLFPVFKAAEELGAAIFVHPWDMMGSHLMGKYFLPWLVGMPAETSLAICSMMFAGVFERLPNLRVCFAHGGGAFAGSLGRIQHGWAVRPDLTQVDCATSPLDHLKAGRVWVDSLVHDPFELENVVRVFGQKRVCLGSDWPFPLGEYTPESGGTEYAAGHLIDQMTAEGRAGWDDGGPLRAGVLGGNALEWLARTEADFRR